MSETQDILEEAKELIEEFCEDCRLRNMTDESIRRYKSSLKIFAKFLADRGVRMVDVDKKVLKAFLSFLRQRGVKYKTLENYFSALSSFYDFLVFEELVDRNIVLPFRRRYLRRYKDDCDDPERRIISVGEMSKLVNSILDPRDKAIVVLLAKTGIRRGELIRIDVDDINWEDYSITLKPTAKRSRRVVFFDDECAIVLKRWLRIREKLKPKTKALFVSYQSCERIDRNTVYRIVTTYAQRLGLHNPESDRIEDHFTPHYLRHWFTTMMRRRGMPREFLKELRGDKRKEAVDRYDHIDREELRRMYLACVPKLGIY